MGGGAQRPFGIFPKTHPFWYAYMSLSPTASGYHDLKLMSQPEGSLGQMVPTASAPSTLPSSNIPLPPSPTFCSLPTLFYPLLPSHPLLINSHLLSNCPSNLLPSFSDPKSFDHIVLHYILCPPKPTPYQKTNGSPSLSCFPIF